MLGRKWSFCCWVDQVCSLLSQTDTCRAPRTDMIVAWARRLSLHLLSPHLRSGNQLGSGLLWCLRSSGLSSICLDQFCSLDFWPTLATLLVGSGIKHLGPQLWCFQYQWQLGTTPCLRSEARHSRDLGRREPMLWYVRICRGCFWMVWDPAFHSGSGWSHCLRILRSCFSRTSRDWMMPYLSFSAS